jgi:hypothetical protein
MMNLENKINQNIQARIKGLRRYVKRIVITW